MEETINTINVYELIDDEPTNDGFYRVMNFDNKENIVNKHGKPISPIWFDNIAEFAFDEHEQSIVLLNGKYNIINKDGSLVFQDWKNDIYAYDKDDNPYGFNTGNSYINIDGDEFLWKENGKLIQCK